MSDIVLTPEQEAEAQRLAAIIGKKAQKETLRMARLLASKADAQRGRRRLWIGHKCSRQAFQSS
jgi:hypothetical protein